MKIGWPLVWICFGLALDVSDMFGSPTKGAYRLYSQMADNLKILLMYSFKQAQSTLFESIKVLLNCRLKNKVSKSSKSESISEILSKL